MSLPQLRTTSIKFIIIGDSNTGKTTLAQYFANDTFINTEATIGLDFVRKSVLDQRYGVINFTLWDTSGAERYHHASLTQTYYRGAEGVIVVFDLTSRASFTNVYDKWFPRLRTVFSSMKMSHKCILVGNKSDLVKEREVSSDEAIDMATQNGMNYVELSSIKSECSLIRLPFLIVAKQLIDEGICRPMDGSNLHMGIRLSHSSQYDRKSGGDGDHDNDTTCCNTSS